MQKIMSVRGSLEQGSLDQRIKEIYVDEQRVPYNRERYIRAIDRFTELFPSEKEIEIYSAPHPPDIRPDVALHAYRQGF